MLPENSLLVKHLPADYADVFEYCIKSKKHISTDDIMINFWLDFPAWINVLVKLRNFLVQFVGLKGSNNNFNAEEFKKAIREGKTYGFITSQEKTDSETVLLLQDKHLNAYISIHNEKQLEYQKISVITLVYFHNKLGHVYFFFIKPFHKLIVKSLLKRTVLNTIQK